MSPSQKKWTAVLAVLVLLCAFFTPLSAYNAYPLIVSLLQALVCAFFVFLVLGNYSSVGEAYWGMVDEEDPTTKDGIVVYGPIGAFVFFIFFFYIATSTRIEYLLKQGGIRVAAKVASGSSTTVGSWRRKSSFYDLKVSFTTPQGQEITSNVDVDKNTFKSVYEGQVVEAVYLPEQPSITRLLLSSDDVQSFIGVKNRVMVLKDIKALFSLADDKIKPFLDKISYKWESRKDPELGGIVLYTNAFTDEQIAKTEQGVFYVTKERVDFSEYDEFLGGDKVVDKQKLSEGTAYFTKDFEISRKVNNSGSITSRILFIQKR